MRRREFIAVLDGTALPTLPRLASAQAYPSRPVRIIVGFGPGGVADIIARIMAQWLSEHFGQPFIVDNRPGAGTNIATEAVVKASPDGYTLLLAIISNEINETLFEKLSFNFIQDIAPVASIQRTPAVMEVNPEFPSRTLPEFISYAKAHPGKINMAAVGPGSTTHIFGELFKAMANVDLVTVFYRNPATAYTDLLGGQVQVMFDPIVSSIENIRAGKLRALAVTTTQRLNTLPGVPTIDEFVPGYEASGLLGICAPEKTPTEIIEKLNREIKAALADPNTKSRLAELGGMVVAGSPRDFGRLVAEDTEKWGKVIRATRIRSK